jgi:HSP20 family protein
MHTNIEQAIVTVKSIYEKLTGVPVPEATNQPYAQIPPEVEAEGYVVDKAKELFQTIDALKARSLPRAPIVPQRETGARALPAMPIPCAVVRGEKQLRFVLEMPGVPRQSIDVSVEGSTLRVVAERPLISVERGEQVIASDLAAGRLERVFTLPALASSEDVSAELQDGTLTIRVKLPASATARQRIDVR